MQDQTYVSKYRFTQHSPCKEGFINRIKDKTTLNTDKWHTSLIMNFCILQKGKGNKKNK